MREGDILVVWKLDRLARSMKQLILATVIITGLCLVNHANAQTGLYLVDLNDRTVTQLSTLGGNEPFAVA